MQSEQFELHAEIEQRHWWFVARREIISAVIGAVLPPSPKTTIVDVGCGTGANLAALATQYHCVGIDTSQDAVRLAAQRFPAVRFVCGNAQDMPGTIAAAQLVLLSDVLEHVRDDFQLLSGLLSLAAPGTYFLLTVPADPSLWSQHDQAFGHFRRYKINRFEEIWRGLAVTPLFVSHFNARLFPIVKAVRGWNRWRGRAGGRAGTDFVLPSAASNYVLTRIFAGERGRLARLARGTPSPPYRFGVSLMALLRREAGTIVPRRRPGYLSSDLFDPLAEPVAADA